jgi:hypothetical protein
MPNGPVRRVPTESVKAAETGPLARSAGNGEIRLTDLVLPGADAGAVDRALGKALAEDDPLREGRLQVLVSDRRQGAACVEHAVAQIDLKRAVPARRAEIDAERPRAQGADGEREGRSSSGSAVRWARPSGGSTRRL